MLVALEAANHACKVVCIMYFDTLNFHSPVSFDIMYFIIVLWVFSSHFSHKKYPKCGTALQYTYIQTPLTNPRSGARVSTLS